MKDTTVADLLKSGVAHKLLAAIPIVLAALIVSLLINRSSLIAERESLSLRVAELETSLTRARAGVIADERLAEDQGLVKVRFDELIPIETDYIQAILLRRPAYANQSVRFQLLLQNDQSADLIPRVSLEYFDRTGARISQERLYLGSALALAPGESRSLTGSVAHLDVNKTAYLKVDPL